MKKVNRFAAAALTFALAATTAGCSAPGAITLGNNTKNALTVDGCDVPAGIFINNEISAYRNAMYRVVMEQGSLPTFDDMKKAKIEDMDAEDWIQDQATETCKLYVAIEKEFDKIDGKLTQEEEDEIKKYIKSVRDNDLFKDNGISEDSLLKVYRNSYKQEYLFDHYYGIDAEKGCSEEDLKKYFTDNTARIKYIEIKLTDAEGNAYDEDIKRKIDKKVDSWVKEINDVKDDEEKLKKMDDIKTEYEEFSSTLTTSADGETGTTTTTTTTATTTETTGTTTAGTTQTDENGSVITTTTTTTSPYQNEITVTKYVTTTADKDEQPNTTTTQSEAEVAVKKYNDFVFDDLKEYEAVKYNYDDSTIYLVIKGDITKRMTKDDYWSDDNIDALLKQRYGVDFDDWLNAIADSYSVEKNKSAYKRYAPFKLDIEDVSLYG